MPDDWACYYVTCSQCGRKYHASEGWCQCEDEDHCPVCGDALEETTEGAWLCTSCGKTFTEGELDAISGS